MIRKTVDGALVDGAQQLGAGDYIGWFRGSKKFVVWNSDHPDQTLCWDDGNTQKFIFTNEEPVYAFLELLAEGLNLKAENASNSYPGSVTIQLVAKA